jgi:hypothetical protein
MKLPSHLLPIIPLVASLMTAHAATHAVLPGTSIQTKINLAVAGDIVAIFGGTYNEDITINKAIRLVEVSGQQVTITGNVTFSGVSDCPPFDGFTVGSSGRGITVANTTGLVLRNLDARNGSGITLDGTSVLAISGGQLSTLNQTGGTLHMAGVAVLGNLETQTGAEKTVAFRTTVAGDANLRSKRAWVGYSEARSINFTDANAAKLVVVGCLVDRQGAEANGIYCAVSNSQIQLVNNRIIRVGYSRSGWWWDGADGECGIDLRGGGNKAFVSNNYCQLTFYGSDNGIRGDGIYVRDFADATIINNLIVGAKHGISAPFGAVAKNNLYWASPWSAKEANGVIAEGTLYADPLFVENEAPKLQAGSPCLNAGTPDPRYNDRDGSRNDIGPSGGAWFDPDGWTTENPVVISFDLSPDMVLEGIDTEVILSEGQAVSAP